MIRKAAKKRKIIKALPIKKPKPLNPKFKLKIGVGAEDPFFIHHETIPNGVALQWIISSVMGQPEQRHIQEALRAGWKLVEGQNEVGGQVLMWAPEEVAKAQADVDRSCAKQQIAEARALFGMDGQLPSPYHGRVKIVDKDFVEAKVYESVPSDAPSIDVDVTIKIRVSARWQDAASALGLEVEEYTRRRLFMEPIVLGPCSLAYYTGMDNVSSRSDVYEPVQLFTKRID